jgi:hypothetical protein
MADDLADIEGIQPVKKNESIWEFASESSRDQAASSLENKGFRAKKTYVLTVDVDSAADDQKVKDTVKSVDRYAQRMRHDT